MWLKLEPCLFAGTTDNLLRSFPENHLPSKTLPEIRDLKGALNFLLNVVT